MLASVQVSSLLSPKSRDAGTASETHWHRISQINCKTEISNITSVFLLQNCTKLSILATVLMKVFQIIPKQYFNDFFNVKNWRKF